MYAYVWRQEILAQVSEDQTLGPVMVPRLLCYSRKVNVGLLTDRQMVAWLVGWMDGRADDSASRGEGKGKECTERAHACNTNKHTVEKETL